MFKYVLTMHIGQTNIDKCMYRKTNIAIAPHVTFRSRRAKYLSTYVSKYIAKMVKLMTTTKLPAIVKFFNVKGAL